MCLSRNMVGQFSNSRKPICIDQSRFHNISLWHFYVKLQTILASFNMSPLVSWVAHIARDFVTSYFCSYYSSMIIWKSSQLDSFKLKIRTLRKDLIKDLITSFWHYTKINVQQKFFGFDINYYLRLLLLPAPFKSSKLSGVITPITTKTRYL